MLHRSLHAISAVSSNPELSLERSPRRPEKRRRQASVMRIADAVRRDLELLSELDRHWAQAIPDALAHASPARHLGARQVRVAQASDRPLVILLPSRPPGVRLVRVVGPVAVDRDSRHLTPHLRRLRVLLRHSPAEVLEVFSSSRRHPPTRPVLERGEALEDYVPRVSWLSRAPPFSRQFIHTALVSQRVALTKGPPNKHWSPSTFRTFGSRASRANWRTVASSTTGSPPGSRR